MRQFAKNTYWVKYEGETLADVREAYGDRGYGSNGHPSIEEALAEAAKGTCGDNFTVIDWNCRVMAEGQVK